MAAQVPTRRAKRCGSTVQMQAEFCNFSVAASLTAWPTLLSSCDTHLPCPIQTARNYDAAHLPITRFSRTSTHVGKIGSQSPIFLGWTGIHKFYLGHNQVAAVHAALTLVGVAVQAAQFLVPSYEQGRLMAVYIVASALILFGYFYVRRFHFGHTVAEIVNPVRLLLWPWRLLPWRLRMLHWWLRQYSWRLFQTAVFSLVRGSITSFVWAIIVLLFLALVAILPFYILYYLILHFVSSLALAASVAIGVAEGIVYLSKTDLEFQQEYVVGQRLWF